MYVREFTRPKYYKIVLRFDEHAVVSLIKLRYGCPSSCHVATKTLRLPTTNTCTTPRASTRCIVACQDALSSPHHRCALVNWRTSSSSTERARQGAGGTGRLPKETGGRLSRQGLRSRWTRSAGSPQHEADARTSHGADRTRCGAQRLFTRCGGSRVCQQAQARLPQARLPFILATPHRGLQSTHPHGARLYQLYDGQRSRRRHEGNARSTSTIRRSFRLHVLDALTWQIHARL